jgi:hypothetical protein
MIDLTKSQRKALGRVTALGEWKIETLEPSGERGDIYVVVESYMRLSYIITPRGRVVRLGWPTP